MTFFLPIVEGTDENDDKDSDSNSYTFDPIDLRESADTRGFRTSVRGESVRRSTEILIETECERDDGGDGKNDEDLVGVSCPAELKERLGFL